MIPAKNIFSLFACSLILLVLSCKSKESEGKGKPSMMGKWEFVAFTYDTSGNSYKEMPAQERDAQLQRMNTAGKGAVFQFNEDSSYVVTPAGRREDRVVRGHFRSIGNNELEMTPANSTPQPGKIISLDKTTLKMSDSSQGIIVELKKTQ